MGEDVSPLAAERRRATFDVRAMTHALLGGPEAVEKLERFSALVAQDPVFRKDDRAYLSRVDMVRRALEKSRRLIQLRDELQLRGSGGADEEFYSMWRLIDEVLPIGLNLGMFVPAIDGQGTEEQKKKWLPLAQTYSIIGCYAQTEMGHGSNVQGLETVAEYDQSAEEFVIHSPTLTSTKWWPGGLGKASTHALVYARLMLDNKGCGIHAFIVPLRSLTSHEPLPGVTVGDMGPKLGYNTMDNGFLRLDRVRIPRENMLMRYARVSPEGKFSREGHSKLAYGAMVLVRANLVSEAGLSLSKAVTIAVRYSAVRRQFGKPGQPETQIIDYKTQQHTLFPLLATSYAYYFVGRWMMQLYKETVDKLKAGKYDVLPEVHACTSGLKALCTGVASDGIEKCRRVCGGNGYLHASGLPELYASYLPAITFEGDNTVLFLQVARFLVKAAGQVVSGQSLAGTVEYLNKWQSTAALRCTASTTEYILEPTLQLEALQARALGLIFGCARMLSEATSQEEAFHSAAAQLVTAARAHCQFIVAERFHASLQTRFEGTGVNEQLSLLSRLYATSLIEANLGDLLEMEYLQPGQCRLVREAVGDLLAQVRVSAVLLVDAFNFSNHYLGSAIGRYDGDVYPHLFISALQEPLNASHVAKGMEHLRPLLGQNKLRLGQEGSTAGLQRLGGQAADITTMQAKL